MPDLWKPSNGSEGSYMWSLCDHCEKDRASWPVEHGGQDSPENGCPIIAAMFRDGEHPAWIMAEGKPCCTEFNEERELAAVDPEKAPRCDKTIDMFSA